MMITVNKFKDNVSGSLNGKPFSVVYTKEKYDAMKELEGKAHAATTMEEFKAILNDFELLTKETYGNLVEHKTPYIVTDPATGYYHLRLNNQVLKSVHVPLGLVDRIIESVEADIDPLPIIKFFVRMLRNPKRTSDKLNRIVQYINQTYLSPELYAQLINEEGVNPEIARERATVRQTPITNEGLMVTYKVVKELTTKYVDDGNGGTKIVSRYNSVVDEVTGLRTHAKPEFAEDFVFIPGVMGMSGAAFLCDNVEGHIIKVGSTIRHTGWDKVDLNDNNHCAKGLHAGNLDYIRGYQNEGTTTLNVLVDPMDVGAIPLDGNGYIRVLQYFPHGMFNGVNRTLYHSSAYAANNDKAFEAILDETIKGYNAEAQKQIDIVAELKSLI